MVVAFAGTPPFGATTLQALLRRGDDYQVCGVLTAVDRRAGRGRKVHPSAVKQAALAAAPPLPLLQPAKLDADAAAQLAAWAPDVLVVAAYGLILPRRVLELPRLGCINVHASLLPRWRGAAPIERAIAAGDTETGVSIMEMDRGCDTGAVYEAVPHPIMAASTMGGLTEELAELGAAALLRTLDRIRATDLAGAPLLVPTPQDGTLAVYAHKVKKSEAALDWARPAAELARAVRAFNPRPVAYSWHHDRGGGVPLYVRIWRAAPAVVEPELWRGRAAGAVLEWGGVGGGALLLAGAGGEEGEPNALRLLEVQPANGQRQCAAEWAARRAAASGGAGGWFGPEGDG
jgi:methionyl-tRNA formyltransferase